MPALTVKERQHQAREDAIVETAYELIAEQGYEKMNMDDLAKHVGIAKATLYQHFPSKEDVMVGVIVQMMREGEKDMLADADNGLSPISRLENGLRRSLGSRIKFWNGKVTMHNPSAIKRHPRYLEQHAHLFDRLSELIDQAKAEGDINPTLATPVIVHVVMWLFRLDYEALTHLPNCTAAQAVDSLVTIVMNGLKTPAKLQPAIEMSHQRG